jgi:hypothetical protein
MTEDGMRASPDAGVPEPPAGLATPRIAAIRHRARRRWAALAAVMVAVVAVAS